jgi:copper(I)-binding protein
MPQSSVTTGLVGLFLALSLSAAGAQKPVAASNAWIRLPPPGATSAAGFVVIHNPTMYDVYLVSATADVALTIQFREAGTGGQDAVVLKELTAPAYGTIELTPDGTHLLLSGLRRTLQAGDVIPITFSTETDAITVNATVKP